MFETKTPYDIDTWAMEEILKLVQDPAGSLLPPKANRLKIVEILYKALGFDLSPDIALCLVAEPLHQLIISTAGSGKTTLSQIKAFIEKLIRPLTYDNNRPLYGRRMLCLVYNDHNVDQMKDTHLRLANKIMAQRIPGFNVDTEISAYTLHSFCSYWKNEYDLDWGLPKEARALSEYESAEILELCLESVSKRFVIADKPPTASLSRMYTLAHSLLLPYGHPDVRLRFPEVQVEDDALEMIFKFYSVMKKKEEVFDFVDLLLFLKTLMEEKPTARTRIQDHYDYVIADEVQDFTPLMMLLLQYIVGDNKPLLAIGDEDQTLYEFNGADVTNVLNFTRFFPKGEIYTMAINRRCAKVIVDASTALISKNTMRFTKKIQSVRPNGKITGIPYHTEDGMIANIISKLQAMPKEVRDDTIICYRERANSYILAEKLEEAGIKFNVLSGHLPFTHELYGHVESVLAMLHSPADAKQHLNLYKVLSLTIGETHALLGWDPKEQEFTDGRTRLHLRNIDWGRYATKKTFMEDVAFLLEVAENMETARLNSYFPRLFELILKYFWRYRMQNKPKDIPLHEAMTERVRHFYNSPLPYEHFFNRLDVRRKNLRNQTYSKQGTTLSTMHGLKGLEYHTCMIVYLDDAIFPSLDSTLYQQGKALEALEAERRLMFVAMTRPKEEEFLYFPIRNPSLFISELEEAGFINQITPPGQEVKTMSQFFDQPKIETKSSDPVANRLQNIFDSL